MLAVGPQILASLTLISSDLKFQLRQLKVVSQCAIWSSSAPFGELHLVSSIDKYGRQLNSRLIHGSLMLENFKLNFSMAV